MLSLSLRCALEREVVGQPRPLNTIVRSVTVALAGLAETESPLGIYLFVGPSGTGKTHMAQSVARLLHGDPRKLVVADCIQMAGRDEWSALPSQLAPSFRHPAPGHAGSVLAMAPLSILLVEHLEWARPEIVQALVAALETGYLMLPDGKCGSLGGCLVLMTSNLCAREIYDAGRSEIGFSPAQEIEETEKARIYQLVSTAAEKQWGSDLLAHLDDLLVFHRLREGHLPFILRRLLVGLNQQLAPRRISCGIDAQVERYLIARGARFLRQGAWVLVKVFRRFVLFPMADLVHGGRLQPGSRVLVTLDSGDRLRFSVIKEEETPAEFLAEVERPFGVPVEWDERTLASDAGRGAP